MPDRAWTLSQIEEALAALPRPEFKARLKADLERMGAMNDTSPAAAGYEARARTRPAAAPLLRVRSTADAIDFYTRAFGARELMRFDVGGRIPHAEIEINGALILLGDEAPTMGYPSPDTLGGSPVQIRLDVDDPDAVAQRAVAAGARIVLPVSDQFYGERTGTVIDPFGYRWSLTKVLEVLSVDEMHARMRSMPQPAAPPPTVITPYIVAQDAGAAVEFVKTVFDAQALNRGVGSAGGLHVDVRIGDSALMIGGGGPELSWRGESIPTALHVYVPDTDESYARAMRAGASSIMAPADMDYGERSASIVDPAGNRWYIATAKGDRFVPEGSHAVIPCLHPLRAEPLIRFLARAFDAAEIERYVSRDGVIHHAKVQVGATLVEIGEAHGPYQPMPTMFFVSVADAETAYRRAIAAGATSMGEPVDRPFGRLAAVLDPFGNQWHMSSPSGADKP